MEPYARNPFAAGAQRAAEMVERFASVVPADVAEDIRDLNAHREWGDAFLNLCAVLAQEHVPLNASDLAYLRDLGDRWDDPRCPVNWAKLEELVR